MTVDDVIAELAKYPGDWEVVVDQSVGLYSPKYNELSQRGIVRGAYKKIDMYGGKFKDLSDNQYGNVNSICIGYRPGCAYDC